jgi:hypothetical protein
MIWWTCVRRCKVFRDATAARKVGRCMAVHREWRLHWWDKARFLSVLRRCAASSNPEASYILGLVTSGTQIQAKSQRRLPNFTSSVTIPPSLLAGGVLQPEKSERAPAPPPRHGAWTRRRSLHDGDDHVARLAALAGRCRAGAGTLGLLLLRACILWPQQDKAQDGLRAQRGRVGHAKADVASVEDARASNALRESVVRQGGVEEGGGLGRRRRRREVVLQPDLLVETRVLQVYR